MFPILYDSITPGTVPSNYGLGVLSDCLSCVVEEERNSRYELIMEYSASGIHAAEIATRRIIKVKPNYTDAPQLFRIYKVGKTLDGKFTCYAQHVSYDLTGAVISSGTANNVASAMLLLQSAASGYTFMTDKTTTANFKITEPSSVRSWLAGKQGSILDVFGTGEYHFDNFGVNYLLHRGENRGVTIRYGKNLLELSQELDSSNLYTGVMSYHKDSEGNLTVGNVVTTGLTLDAPNVLVLDVSQNFETAPSVAELDAASASYIGGHNLTAPTNNITLDFVQIGELKDRVDLCDVVNIYYEAYDITVSAKCIRTKWDCLEERYIETEFGDAKTTLAETLAGSAAATEAANSAASAAYAAVEAAASKKRVFITTPEPPYDIGDLWTNTDDIYVCVVKRIFGEEYSIENDWILASDYVNQNYVDENAKKITGNKGGYVMLHDSDGDGNPDEILIVDDPDLTKATQVWRWNKGGLGYANQYDAERYDLAIYPTGEINANMIKVGKLNAAIVEILHLTAKMFEGAEIALGGTDNGNGVFILRNENNIEIGRIDIEGLKFWGKGPVGARPYVKLDLNGLSGYDANNNMIFKVEEDEFIMKKCVAQQEINACGRIKFVPVTTSTNSGVAIVKI